MRVPGARQLRVSCKAPICSEKDGILSRRSILYTHSGSSNAARRCARREREGPHLSLMHVAESLSLMSTSKYSTVRLLPARSLGMPAARAGECLALKRAAVGESLILAGARGAAWAAPTRATMTMARSHALRDIFAAKIRKARRA